MSKDKEEKKTLGEFTSDYADYDPEWYDDEGNYIGGTYVVPEFRIDEGSVAWQAQKAAEQHRQLAPTYTPSYANSIANILAEIGNRGKFSYDVNGDAIYHQYKDKYTQQGKLAMQDAMGQASAMTGGYGNSYAASVGNQAYQAQLGKLNDIIPELYNAAYSRYNQETQDMYNRYNLLNTRENELYSKYRDEYSDWQTEQNHLDSYAADLADDAWNAYVYTTNLGQDQFNKDREFAAGRKEAGYKAGVDAYNASGADGGNYRMTPSEWNEIIENAAMYAEEGKDSLTNYLNGLVNNSGLEPDEAAAILDQYFPLD